MLFALEHHYQRKFGKEDPILGWIFRHAGRILTRYAVKESGLTPFRMLRGRDYNGVVVEIGECVLFKFLQPVPKLAPRWEIGVWLGKKSASDEHIIGYDGGLQYARTVQRRAEDHRWSQKTFATLQGNPWDVKAVEAARPEVRQRYLTKARATHGT